MDDNNVILIILHLFSGFLSSAGSFFTSIVCDPIDCKGRCACLGRMLSSLLDPILIRTVGNSHLHLVLIV